MRRTVSTRILKLGFTFLLLAASPLARSLPPTNSSAPPSILPFRDPPNTTRFRYAPLPDATRSIVLPLGNSLHLAFDTHLLRTYKVTAGPGLQLFGPPFSLAKSPFLAQLDGLLLWDFPQILPWRILPDPKQPGAPPAHFRFVSLRDPADSPVQLSYELSLSNAPPVEIIETPSFLPFPTPTSLSVVRKFRVSPSPIPLEFLAHLESASTNASVLPENASIAILPRANHFLAIAVRSIGSPYSFPLQLSSFASSFTESRILEEGASWKTNVSTQTGTFVQVHIQIPAHPTPLEFEVLSLVSTHSSPADPAHRWQTQAPSTTSTRRVPAFPPKVVRTSRVSNLASPPARTPPTHASAYRIDSIPIPNDIDLLVTGLVVPSNDEAWVSTWRGEVFRVTGLATPSNSIAWNRFAHGLNEPMGITFHGADLHVIQKGEWTRLRDRNADGVADEYSMQGNSWFYSGSYHAFAFGPAIRSDGTLFMALCGAHGRWNTPGTGACFISNLSSSDSTPRPLRPFARGFRSPNGWILYGPNEDLFMTDNQGEWVGACKLNHVRDGHFYGFPSGGATSPHSYSNPPPNFTPPAVWFPRKLSPSASGIAAVPPAGFGPFAGQLIVADWQNGSLMRVQLEKVDGEWQGAVFPFLRGLRGAPNRLAFSPNGRLFVGGCRRTWPSAASVDASLEFIDFTGPPPFEIATVQALPDGFRLQFTEPIDPESGLDPDSYAASQFQYRYHKSYGSPEIDAHGRENRATPLQIQSVKPGPSPTSVDLRFTSWQPGFVTAVRTPGIKSRQGTPLANDTFFYTLNHLGTSPSP